MSSPDRRRRVGACASSVALLVAAAVVAAEPEPIPWSAKRPLAWSDYVGQPQLGGNASAMTAYTFRYEEECEGEAFAFRVVSFFQPAESWVKPAVRSNVAGRIRLLAHEQGHFDLSEVHARRLRRTLSQLRDPCRKTLEERKALVAAQTREDAEAQTRYDWESGYGVNQVQQGRWLTDIGRQLGSLAEYGAAGSPRRGVSERWPF